MTTQPTDQPPRFISVDQLPDDPLKMPPPYWRSSGAVFQIFAALKGVSTKLSQLVSVNSQTLEALKIYYRRDRATDVGQRKFQRVCENLWKLEHEIKVECDRAILMCAISSEDALNLFCVFNLHKDVAENIEKLSLPEKLVVSAAVLGNRGVKATTVYAGAKRLTSWRNAFAHGHCTDRPLKSLRHNHLLHPDEYPGVPSALRETIQYVQAHTTLLQYLRSISVNPYTAGQWESTEIEKYLSAIQKYSFSGNNVVYTIKVNTGGKKVRTKRSGG